MNYVVSFADSRLHRSLTRLVQQARSMEVFNHIFMLNEKNLPADFRDCFKDRLVFGSRGFGYWSWKPEVILMSLEKMNLGDCLLYVDAGCHLNMRGRKRLLEYFEIVKEQETGIVAFQANPPSVGNSSLLHDGRKLVDQPNYRWIKGDLFDYFNMRSDERVVNAQAIGAGIILIKKCDASAAIIDEWRGIIRDRFELLDDTPSISENLEGFIEHRHDQAIWTLLCLKHDVRTLSAYEYWYPQNRLDGKLVPDWGVLRNFPIHAKRDKDLGPWKKSISQLLRVLRKVKSIVR